MKLILIDPKQLEFAFYSTLPHLIMPVVTDAKKRLYLYFGQLMKWREDIQF